MLSLVTIKIKRTFLSILLPIALIVGTIMFNYTPEPTTLWNPFLSTKIGLKYLGAVLILLSFSFVSLVIYDYLKATKNNEHQ